jgi:predicted metalloprotease
MANWGTLGSRGNVEDRRGSPLGILGGGAGIVGVVLYVLFNFLGGGNIDPNVILRELQNTQVQNQQNYTTSDFEGEDSYEVFASTVLGSTNDMWSNIFAQNNYSYTPPQLVLFRSATQSGCGIASSDVGPHYCPTDKTIYLDETFFNELTRRFGAQGGDVAEAYVIAHEVGHHVQNELGLMDQLQSDQSNQASINIELQADCFAGLWAASIKNLNVFEPGEIHEAMDAAAAVGDDRIQASVTGRINPESWTHGSSQERVSWFNRGFETGNVSSCTI